MRLLHAAPALAVAFFATSHASAQLPRTDDLTGTWAQLVVTTSVSTIPVLGDVESVARLYVRVNIAQHGDRLTLRNEACWARIDGPTTRLRTIVPPEMLRAIGPHTRRGVVRGSTIDIPREVDVVGAELPDPWNDPLPTEPDHMWVIDEDRDGHPGVTVRVIGMMSGELRVVQRTWNEMKGTVSRDGQTIEGRVKWRTDQEVLDATNRFLKADPGSRPDPDPDRSRFVMVRIPDDLRCEEIVQRHRQLWPDEHRDG